MPSQYYPRAYNQAVSKTTRNFVQLKRGKRVEAQSDYSGEKITGVVEAIDSRRSTAGYTIVVRVDGFEFKFLNYRPDELEVID